MSYTPTRLHARQILDSRGNPTVEVDVTLQDGSIGRAAVPSGASTGSHEAVELRDGGSAWSGKGVSQAVVNARTALASAVVRHSFEGQADFDAALLAADGTPNKSRLGANAILGASLAFARAVAESRAVPLWRSLATGDTSPVLPVPMLNIVNGGAHANNGLDIQEFMVVPHGFSTFSTALEAAVRVFHRLSKGIAAKGMSTAVGDEGGYAPTLSSNREALELIVSAIEAEGLTPGSDVSIAIDAASSEFFSAGKYRLSDAGELDPDGMVALWSELCDGFPIVSIEDGMAEDDWDGWKSLTAALGDRVQLVGDDLFVTNVERLQQGIDSSVANSILVKVNQIGTLTETFQAMELAADAGYSAVMSHRSGETEDPFIADLAVATACGQIKTGAPSRSDRVAKYNQLLRIEEQLADAAVYAQPFQPAAAGGRV